ncbi:SDR family oxidoreductase [Sorangium sp. So ce1014]|uniref:SDR family oxidoreductase n=1 Tax=Sorangium sp. So ce1014 TaxID=3133326 RepID=UPI003F609F5B
MSDDADAREGGCVKKATAATREAALKLMGRAGLQADDVARRATPLKRRATPEEVSRLIVFLASDQNDFITGAVYGVDGGQPPWGDIWTLPEPEGAPGAPPGAKG